MKLKVRKGRIYLPNFGGNPGGYWLFHCPLCNQTSGGWPSWEKALERGWFWHGGCIRGWHADPVPGIKRNV